MAATATSIEELIKIGSGVEGAIVAIQRDGFVVSIRARDDAFRVAGLILDSFMEDPESGDDVEVRVRRKIVGRLPGGVSLETWLVRVEYVR